MTSSIVQFDKLVKAYHDANAAIDNDKAYVFSRMIEIETQAMDNAKAQFQPLLDDAESKAKAANENATAIEKERDSIRDIVKSLEGRITETTKAHDAEKLISKAMHEAHENERIKSRSLESQVMEMTGRISEMERHNNTLQNGMQGITAEIGKRQPVMPKIPEFNFEVVARDQYGAIKKITIKPKNPVGIEPVLQ
jgi:predicted  nucleic acid-binding Zn-ribbon protein